MIRKKIFVSMIIIFMQAFTAFIGCSYNSGPGPFREPAQNSTTRGTFEVTMVNYGLSTGNEFGNVTVGNTPASREVALVNNSPFEVIVSDMILSDPDNFVLNTSRGTNPCGTNAPTLAVGANCTVEVTFTPLSVSSLEETLTIESNYRENPAIDVALRGTGDPISDISVIINQVTIECPEVTAYVSVTDQEGYPLSELSEDDFTVEEDGRVIAPLNSFDFVSEMMIPISVALIMDSSGSIRSTAGAIEKMEAGVTEFIGLLTENDEAEIIKFTSNVDVVQEFTSDKAALTSAVTTHWESGGTSLYDAIHKAVEDTSKNINSRRAIVVITDGADNSSDNTLPQIIHYVSTQEIPIFTIGLGRNIDPVILQQIAHSSGGQYYDTRGPYDIITIYQQLASLLFINQYVLTYDSTTDAAGNLLIEADFQQRVGGDTKDFTPCPGP